MAGSSSQFARLRARTRDPALAERASAEAFAAGACGLEEREVTGSIELLVYAERARAGAVRDALVAAGLPPDAVAPVPEEDWSGAWRKQLRAIPISDRLVVRPSFVDFAPAPGQQELLIEPGQAFGTGSHESTRLALEWVSELAPRLAADACILDAGIGSGVLALAALRLCPLAGVRAIGFDLDPLAAEAAVSNARANALAARLGCFTGGVEALAPGARFALILANLLRSELEPILPALAVRLSGEGSLVLSGLLESEAARVLAQSAVLGLRESGRRLLVDASGVPWIALRMQHTG